MEHSVTVYYCRFDKKLPDELMDRYLEQLPVKFRKEALSFKKWQDNYAYLFGKLLLLKALQNKNFPFEILENLRFNNYSRPYLPGPFDFNISHSADFVLCAIAQNIRLGIDIEKRRSIDFNYFQKVMTKKQWTEIHSSIYPFLVFFDYWTIKEGLIKAVGKGLSIPLDQIEIDNQLLLYKKKNWYFRKLNLHKDYSCHIITNRALAGINCVKVKF